MEDYQGNLTGAQIDKLPSDVDKLANTISSLKTTVNGFSELVDEKYAKVKNDAYYEFDLRVNPIVQTLNEYRSRLAAL